MIEARDYQIEAVNNAKEYQWQGVLEMATGTGKTFTSLLISDAYFDLNGYMMTVVIVPFEHLIEQWKDNMNLFDYDVVLPLQGGFQKNKHKIKEVIRTFRRKITTKAAIIVTYTSFIHDDFQKDLKLIGDDVFLIADECHNFGIPSYLDKDFSYIQNRIGLSATPVRHFDPEGSNFIMDYFQNILLEINLKDAIENDYLTPYEYEYIFAHLNEEEYEEYLRITRRIAFYLSKKKLTEKELKELNDYRIFRSQIVKAAEDKVDLLIEHLKQRNLEDLSHILIYCAPGTIDPITKRVADLGLRVHNFDHRTSYKKRQEILDAFDKGHIQVILAMNCLDEGVDVPATKEAYFLSSTSNPREYVQRRGRVLRKYKNKTKAKIYDFIMLAPPEYVRDSYSILQSELPRFIEFTEASINKYHIYNQMLRSLEEMGLERGLLKARKEYYEKEQ